MVSRAFDLYGVVDKSLENKNIFSAFDGYYRISYTHNPVANTLLTQFKESVDESIPLGKLLLTNDDFIYTFFKNDQDIASMSWIRATKSEEDGYSYSLFLARWFEMYRERMVTEYQSQFPRGIPHIAMNNYFLLEDAIDWLPEKLSNLPQPFMGYFHFMPPHDPYNTHKKFVGYFADDGYWPIFKPLDLFSDEKNRNFEFLLRKRTSYDEFILYVDHEFGRLMNALEKTGLLQNTWVILTSDHGEMFERGILGHLTPVLYQPVIRVPLVIFEPGRKTRTDIFTNTSAVDILPTLLHLTGQKPADWSEGKVLPPFSNVQEPDRSLYVIQARKNPQDAPLTAATVALIKDQYKLVYHFGYEELKAKGDRIELYDLRNDPEETNDLYQTNKEIGVDLLSELKTKLINVNQPYTK